MLQVVHALELFLISFYFLRKPEKMQVMDSLKTVYVLVYDRNRGGLDRDTC